MRYKNPNARGSLTWLSWETVHDVARTLLAFQAGSQKSKVDSLFEALVAGIGGEDPGSLSHCEAALRRALNSLRNARKEDDTTGRADEEEFKRQYGPKTESIPDWAIALQCGTPPYTRAKIKAAYRELAKKYHPDVAGSASTQRMQEINAALRAAMKEVKE